MANPIDSKHPLRGLLVAQFFGAFNDNAWKLVVIVLAGRTLSGLSVAEMERATQTQAMLASVVLTISLMLFSLPAGALADRLSKRTVIVAMKGFEVAIMAAGTLILLAAPGSLWGLFVILGLLGLQSALFSPAKYGILPELVGHDRLAIANGSLQLWTFAAIISGTALGPVVLSTSGSRPWLAGAALTVLAFVGFVASRSVPWVPPAATSGSVVGAIATAVRTVRSDRTLFLTIAGSTWFWATASLLGQNVLVYAKSVLQLPEWATGVPLGVFGIGIGLGSVLAGRLSESKVEMGLVPLGAFGMAAVTFVLGAAGPGTLWTLVLMSLMGVASGLLIVPLEALLQWRSPAAGRGAIIALANVFVFGGTLAGSMTGWFMAQAHLSVRGILVGAALLTLAGTLWALWLLPEAFLRLVVFVWTHVFYRLRVTGREHVPAGGGVLLAPNHVSFVDGCFLVATLDRPVRFIVEESWYNRPWLRPFMKAGGAIPISSEGGPRNLLRALRTAGDALDRGEVVCIFPEGQVTRTGGLLPFRRGIERISKGRTAAMVPVYLDRVWGSIFSFARGRFIWKLPDRLPYPVTVSFGRPLSSDATVAQLRQAVQSLGEQAWHERKEDRQTLHRTFIGSVRRRPWRMAMSDASGRRLSRVGALAGSIALARALRRHWAGQETVGLLLPTTIAGAVANVAASLTGRTSVNLNFTTGAAGMASAARQAGLTKVLTSRMFVEKAKLELPEGLEPLYLEDLQPTISPIARGWAVVLALLAPVRWVESSCGAIKHMSVDDVVTVIFSSGSTGEPKGVMLTHFNIDSNVQGVAQVFRLEPTDGLIGVLPLFHSFGYLSLWFALDNGTPVVLHPSPIDAAAVGKLVQDYGLTILLATPTFLQLYLRRCTPEQFGSLRIVLTGAEKLTERLSQEFEDTFGIRPLEGYGTTECSPVVATSVPPFRASGFFQRGSRRETVGVPLPGITVRVVDPDSFEPIAIDTPGMLLVRGPNVMKGYLNRPDLTEKALRDGWYVTGDIARLDADGFIRITDRLSRFSKIGGEMVPHGRVEDALHEAYGSGGRQLFAVTAVPDERKGEKLAVLTVAKDADIPVLLKKLGEAGLPNLFIPRKNCFVSVDAFPVLGTGKLDLRELKRIATEKLAL